MEVFAKELKFKEKLRLIPFSDLHLGSRAATETKFKRLVDWILSKPDTYAIGLGDYCDAVLRQDMKRFSGKCTKDELLDLLDSAINEQRNLVIKYLKPLADNGRLLGLCEGNHEESLKKHHSFDMLKDVCHALNVPYLGFSFFYRLTLSKIEKKPTKRSLVIYGHHGFGSSRKPGASLNRKVDMISSYDADIILMGHDHHKFGSRMIKLGITPYGIPRIVHKPVIVAATGSFLKSVVQGDTTYSEKYGYRPNDIGVVRIDIRMSGRFHDFDIHCSE